MKITLTYGLGIAIANMVLIFLMFFLGYHTDPARFDTGQTIGTIGGITIMIVGLVLGMRAKRDTTPDQSLSYGRAVGTGALISVFAGLFGALFALIYGMVINPAFHEMLYQVQVAKMEESGMPSEQVETAAGMVRFFTGAIWMFIAQLVFTPIFGTILSLIIAIFVKRPPSNEPPPVTV